MPIFYPEDLDIDVDEFLNSCDKKEIEEVIDYLKETGWLCESYLIKLSGSESMNEKIFYESLDKIKNNWISLSKEEEDIILNIAKRF